MKGSGMGAMITWEKKKEVQKVVEEAKESTPQVSGSDRESTSSRHGGPPNTVLTFLFFVSRNM